MTRPNLTFVNDLLQTIGAWGRRSIRWRASISATVPRRTGYELDAIDARDGTARGPEVERALKNGRSTAA